LTVIRFCRNLVVSPVSVADQNGAVISITSIMSSFAPCVWAARALLAAEAT
jgi:hypothetical protein